MQTMGEGMLILKTPMGLWGKTPMDLRGKTPMDLRGKTPMGLRGKTPMGLRGYGMRKVDCTLPLGSRKVMVFPANQTASSNPQYRSMTVSWPVCV